MKFLLTILVGIIGAILGAAAVTLLSGNNVAIQLFGRDNKIEQKIETHPVSSQSMSSAPQSPSQLPIQAPPVTATQPQPSVTGFESPTIVSAPAPAPTTSTNYRRTYKYVDAVQYEEECVCPEEAEEVVEETYDEVEECDCEEEPPIT